MGNHKYITGKYYGKPKIITKSKLEDFRELCGAQIFSKGFWKEACLLGGWSRPIASLDHSETYCFHKATRGPLASLQLKLYRPNGQENNLSAHHMGSGNRATLSLAMTMCRPLKTFKLVCVLTITKERLKSLADGWSLGLLLWWKVKGMDSGCCHSNVGGPSDPTVFNTNLNSITHSKGFPAYVSFGTLTANWDSFRFISGQISLFSIFVIM